MCHKVLGFGIGKSLTVKWLGSVEKRKEHAQVLSYLIATRWGQIIV